MLARRWIAVVAILLIGGLGLVACSSRRPTAQVVKETVVVRETVIQTKVETRVLTQTQEVRVVVTATPIPKPAHAEAIVVAIGQEPDTLYSLTAALAAQPLLSRAINEPFITRLNYDYQHNPNLLESLPTLENGGAVLDDGGTPNDPTDDQLTITWKMKPGLKWSDGHPLTAKDWLFAYNVAKDPDSGLASTVLLNKIETYEAVDDLTVRVRLKKGVLDPAYVLALDLTDNLHPLPEHAWGKYTPKEMIGAEEVARRSSPNYGPYSVAEWIAGEQIILKANPNYYGARDGKPAVKTLIFKIMPDPYQVIAQLLAGKVDVATPDALQGLPVSLLEQLNEAGLLKAHWLPSTTWEHLDFNLNMPSSVNKDQANLSEPHFALSDARVRQAIAWGIDRQAMLNSIYAGHSVVLNTHIPQGHWAYAGDEHITVYRPDREKAKALLEQAGWKLGADGIREKNGKRLSLKVTAASDPLREKIVGLLQGQMKAIGIEIVPDLIPSRLWFGDEGRLLRRDFDIAEFAWMGEADPGGETLYRCDQIPLPTNRWTGQNVMGWCNEKADEAVRRANNTLSRKERAAAYRVLQQEFTRDVPSLPLFSRLHIYATNPNFRNLKPDPTEEVTWNVAEWDLPGK
jgi:peptide/nickel transport system substrate-binding protein